MTVSATDMHTGLGVADGGAERVHRLQRAMAAAAGLLSVVVLLWSLVVGLVPLYLLPCAAYVGAAFVGRGSAFRGYCLVLGVLTLILSLPLVLLGFFALIPSAVLLLLARGADPRRRPVLARVWAGIDAVVLAASLAAVVTVGYDAWLKPTHTFRAEMDPQRAPLYAGGTQDDDGPDPWAEFPPYGATSASLVSGDGAIHLHVDFSPDLDAAGQRALREAIARLPGVERVTRCGRGSCYS